MSTVEKDHCSMEWTREKTLILIEEYRKRRGLWDMTHEYYRKKGIKKELLDEVSLKFGKAVPPIEIEKKFHTLRTQYHREISRMQQLKGGKEPYKSKWFAFKHLQFLSSPKACRTSKSLKIKIECDPKIISAEEPGTKFLIKEISNYETDQQCEMHTECISPEKSEEEDSDNNSKAAGEVDTRKELETLFENATKNVEEQQESKVIIKEINVPVHTFRGTTEHKVVASTTFETGTHQPQHQESEDQHHLIETTNNVAGHESIEDIHTYQHQPRISRVSSQKRDLYEEVMFEEENPSKTDKTSVYYDKSSGRDEYNVFGEYVANELRFITSREILFQVKHKINTAIFEANMAQLNKNY